jgi:hypothetical protein
MIVKGAAERPVGFVVMVRVHLPAGHFYPAAMYRGILIVLSWMTIFRNRPACYRAIARTNVWRKAQGEPALAKEHLRILRVFRADVPRGRPRKKKSN